MNRFLVAAVALLLTGGAQAAPLQIERFSGDTLFNDRCGGLDNFGCEWLVAEGRAGNRGTGGTWERGFFDRISNTATNEDSSSGTDFGIANAFTLSYDGMGMTSFTYLGGTLDISGIAFDTGYAGDNPTAPARTLYLRVRDANLTGLSLMSGGSTHAVGDGLLTGIGAGGPEYLVIGGFDVTAAWTLTGSALLGTGNNSGSAFQVKVTDVPPIPLPAAGLLLLGGAGALGALRMRRKPA